MFIMGVFDEHGELGHSVAHFLLMDLIQYFYKRQQDDKNDARGWIDIFKMMNHKIPPRFSRQSGSTASIVVGVLIVEDERSVLVDLLLIDISSLISSPCQYQVFICECIGRRRLRFRFRWLLNSNWGKYYTLVYVYILVLLKE